MEYRPLGRSDLSVSSLCLGTMTWGSQNTEAEGHAQMSRAVEAGINFFDTAEMYPVPPDEKWAFRTEEIIGSWFRATGLRDRVVLATKIVGPSPNATWVRGGKTRHDARHIAEAVDASLKRLQTDVIDLYQLHWPDRHVNRFSQRGFMPVGEEDLTPMRETLEALDAQVKAGKIRTIGLSNETPWGLMTAVHLAETLGLPRVVSIQNPYNLLNRTFEVGLAECAWREDVGLLAYAPLAAGTLTGKYLDGQIPKGSRREFDAGRGSRYDRPNGEAATRRYLEVAEKHGLDPVHMALAFVRTRPFCTSAIIGARSMEQLERELAAAEMTLDEDVVEDIEAVQNAIPDPCP